MLSHISQFSCFHYVICSSRDLPAVNNKGNRSLCLATLAGKRSNSLYAITGCHPSSGVSFNTTSMAAAVGYDNKYYLARVIDSEPEFAFIYRNGRFHATSQKSLQVAWGLRDERIQKTRRRMAAKNLITNLSQSDRRVRSD